MRKLAYILPVLSGILFGSTGQFVRILNEEGFNGITIVSQRALFAVTIMGIAFLIYDRNLLKIRIHDLWAFAIAGIGGITMLNLCYNEAIVTLSMSFAAVLLSMFPIFVFILSAILFKERITMRKVVGASVAIAGCFLVSGIVDDMAQFTANSSGILFGVMSAMFYSLYSVGSRFALAKGYHAFTITFYSLLLMILVLVPFADWSDTFRFVCGAPISRISFMVLHSLCSAVLSYLFFTISLKYIDSGTASILASGEAASAMVFGAVFFGEIPTMSQVVGLLVATVAISFVCLPDKRIREK